MEIKKIRPKMLSGVQNAANFKANQQLEAAEKRLSDISFKLQQANARILEADSNLSSSGRKEFDWTQSYNVWSKYEDIDDLAVKKREEEDKITSLISNQQVMGHVHDHSIERQFFESSEEFKLKTCEDNRLIGNYLFSEGLFHKAAEHYQLAIAYYEYCFPEDADLQRRLNALRHICLCNISLCYIRMNALRSAAESASIVLNEVDPEKLKEEEFAEDVDTADVQVDTAPLSAIYVKALFRRAQAFRYLDEYRLCA